MCQEPYFKTKAVGAVLAIIAIVVFLIYSVGQTGGGRTTRMLLESGELSSETVDWAVSLPVLSVSWDGLSEDGLNILPGQYLLWDQANNVFVVFTFPDTLEGVELHRPGSKR